MNVFNVTKNDFNNIRSSNYTGNTTSTNYTDTKKCTNNIDIFVPSLSILPCGLSFLCLLSLMVYTLIKPLITNK